MHDFFIKRPWQEHTLVLLKRAPGKKSFLQVLDDLKLISYRVCPTFIFLMTDKIIPFNFKSSCLEDPRLSYVAIFRGYWQVYLLFFGNPPAERPKDIQTGISDSFTCGKPWFLQWSNMYPKQIHSPWLTSTHVYTLPGSFTILWGTFGKGTKPKLLLEEKWRVYFQ